MVGMAKKSARLYGLPEPGQTDISCLPGMRCDSESWAFPAAGSAVFLDPFRPGA